MPIVIKNTDGLYLALSGVLMLPGLGIGPDEQWCAVFKDIEVARDTVASCLEFRLAGSPYELEEVTHDKVVTILEGLYELGVRWWVVFRGDEFQVYNIYDCFKAR
jgi:hypothetical protein